jgi:hypothetical protein
MYAMTRRAELALPQPATGSAGVFAALAALWRRVAEDAWMVVGLLGFAVATVALRVATYPYTVIPHGFAVTTLLVATIVAVGAFALAALQRARSEQR